MFVESFIQDEVSHMTDVWILFWVSHMANVQASVLMHLSAWKYIPFPQIKPIWIYRVGKPIAHNAQPSLGKPQIAHILEKWMDISEVGNEKR